MSSTKMCKICGKIKDTIAYHKAKGNTDGLHSTCKMCRSEEAREIRSDKVRAQERKSYRKHKDKNNERSFIYNVKKNYGITIEEYDKCMATSNVCEHCGKEETLCYDHDHSEIKNIEAFRGVLCRNCNSALGMLGDTLEDVERMLNYLRRYRDAN